MSSVSTQLHGYADRPAPTANAPVPDTYKESAGKVRTKAVAEALRAHEFETVLGRIGFDEKGDVTGYKPFSWYVWKDGDYVPVDPSELTD